MDPNFKLNFLLRKISKFLNYWFRMKCPYVLKLNLPQFFSYMHYSCHTSQLKYTKTIWTTLYKFEMILLHRIITHREWLNSQKADKNQTLGFRYCCTIAKYRGVLKGHITKLWTKEFAWILSNGSLLFCFNILCSYTIEFN